SGLTLDISIARSRGVLDELASVSEKQIPARVDVQLRILVWPQRESTTRFFEVEVHIIIYVYRRITRTVRSAVDVNKSSLSVVKINVTASAAGNDRGGGDCGRGSRAAFPVYNYVGRTG